MIHFRFAKNLIFGTGNSQGGYFEDINWKNQLDIYKNLAVTRAQHPDREYDFIILDDQYVKSKVSKEG